MTISLPYQLYGHDKQWQDIISFFQKESLPSSLLIHGVQGIGKILFAKNFLYYALYHGATSKDNFTTQFTAESLVDMRIIIPDSEHGKSQDIKSDTIRSLKDFFQLKPIHNKYRIAIIDDAHMMTHTAANSLLKLLEEPPSNSFIILVTHTSNMLLKTIRSRCQHIALHPLQDDVFKNILPQLGIENHDDAYLNMLCGCIGTALSWQQYDAYILYQWLQDFLQCQTSHDEDMVMAKSLGQKDQSKRYEIFCHMIMSYFHRIIKEMTLRNDNIQPMLQLMDDIQILLKSYQSPSYLAKEHILIQVFYKIKLSFTS